MAGFLEKKCEVLLQYYLFTQLMYKLYHYSCIQQAKPDKPVGEACVTSCP